MGARRHPGDSNVDEHICSHTHARALGGHPGILLDHLQHLSHLDLGGECVPVGNDRLSIAAIPTVHYTQ